MFAKVGVIPTTGMGEQLEGSFNIGSCWESFHAERLAWLPNGYVQWRLFFDPQVIQDVVSIAAAFRESEPFEPYDEHYDALRRPSKCF
ncbi:MAG: hypothetical protein LAO56_18465 [Acidobacteriia bacterium]|nr:hypothetical protein [Terriglobia bacterium]